MNSNTRVQINLYVPMEIRDELRRMAAQRMLDNPSENWSAASIAAEILLNHLTQKRKDKSDE